MGKAGPAFTQNDTITYGYNARSEVTSAIAANDTSYNYGYNFDDIGNRITSTIPGTTTNYTSNNLNQYTVAGSLSPTYDNDGNMLTNGDWTYTWNAENRLIKAEKSTQKLEFSYDYMGRRIEKTVYDKTGSVWTLSQHEYFVYDDYELIEVLNALDGSSVKQKFTWGNGLACVVDGSNTYYYLCDGNQNITQLLDGAGNIVAKYEYSPFGKLTVSSGNYTDNPFRFSTEFYDTETELEYYNYRYYSPALGRWIKRDPIKEMGGLNIYGMVGNRTINGIDSLGLGNAAENGKNVVIFNTNKCGENNLKKFPGKSPSEIWDIIQDNNKTTGMELQELLSDLWRELKKEKECPEERDDKCTPNTSEEYRREKITCYKYDPSSNDMVPATNGTRIYTKHCKSVGTSGKTRWFPDYNNPKESCPGGIYPAGNLDNARQEYENTQTERQRKKAEAAEKAAAAAAEEAKRQRESDPRQDLIQKLKAGVDAGFISRDEAISRLQNYDRGR